MKKMTTLGIALIVMGLGVTTALHSSSAANVAQVRFNVTYPASAGANGFD